LSKPLAPSAVLILEKIRYPGGMGKWGDGKSSESVIQWVSKSVGGWAVDSEKKTDDRVES
jgi:hypothetical protein